MDIKLTNDTYPDIEEILSHERFATYLRWAAGARDRAVELYTLNAKLSESLYTPLQMLEIALRNRVDQVMANAFGDLWFDLPEYQANIRQVDMLGRVRMDLAAERKTETPGAIVAALTFGFWTSMLGGEYENLWQTTLNRIARRDDGKGLRRKDLSAPLTPIRILRNRIAHHEPILHWDLPRHYEAIVRTTGWLSPIAAAWCRDHSRFESLYPPGGVFPDR
jgi:hypothetical protein